MCSCFYQFWFASTTKEKPVPLLLNNSGCDTNVISYYLFLVATGERLRGGHLLHFLVCLFVFGFLGFFKPEKHLSFLFGHNAIGHVTHSLMEAESGHGGQFFRSVISRSKKKIILLLRDNDWFSRASSPSASSPPFPPHPENLPNR